MIRVDTNMIIRFLLNDHIEMANIAEKVLTTRDVYIANEILAEVVYVLLGVYDISRSDIADRLTELIGFKNISVSNPEIVALSLELFKTKKLDFVDCLLCAYAKLDEVVTFDKQLIRCISTFQDN